MVAQWILDGAQAKSNETGTFRATTVSTAVEACV